MIGSFKMWNLRRERSSQEQEQPTENVSGAKVKIILDRMSKLKIDESQNCVEIKIQEDEGFRDYLDAAYPNWKDNHETYFIPKYGDIIIDETKEERGIVIEKKMVKKFQALKENNMFVVHGQDFAEKVHDFGVSSKSTWIRGENDICIIHQKYGIIFFEVKSGRPTPTSKFNKGLEQIKKVKKATSSFITKYAVTEKISGKNIKLLKEIIMSRKGFVILPDVPGEYAPKDDNVIHAGNVATEDDFQTWWNINIVEPYERETDKKKNAIAVINDLAVKFLLLERFLVLTGGYRTLKYEIDGFEYLVTKILTPDQLKYMGKPPCELWINGPAGSGKTDILIAKVQELAERIKSNKMKDSILVICYNKPLAEFFLKTFNDYSVVSVMTYDRLVRLLTGELPVQEYSYTLSTEKKCNIINEIINHFKETQYRGRYDHIFIDESQDLFGNWYYLLEALHVTYDVCEEMEEENYEEDEKDHQEDRERILLGNNQFAVYPSSLFPEDDDDNDQDVDDNNGHDVDDNNDADNDSIQSSSPNKLKGKYLWIVYDPNQEINFSGMSRELQTTITRRMNSGQDLDTVIRNTGTIFRGFRNFAFSTGTYIMKLGHQNQGRDIKWITITSTKLDNVKEALLRELKCLLDQGIFPGQIAFITSVKDDADELREMLNGQFHGRSNTVSMEARASPLEFVDAETWVKSGRWNSGSIVIDSVRRFKGLDNKVVILIEPYNFHRSSSIYDKDQLRKLLYVAYSRAACLLVILTTEENRRLLINFGNGYRKRSRSVCYEDSHKRTKPQI